MLIKLPARMEVSKLTAVVIVAVLFCSVCVDGCTISHRPYVFHKIARGVYCKLIRTDGGTFGSCAGTCASAAKFDLVVNGDLSDHRRATAGCTAVQNCCKETGKAHFGSVIGSSITLAYDPSYRPSDCAWRSASSVYVTSATSCACNPCHSNTIPAVSQVNNDRTLIPESCKT